MTSKESLVGRATDTNDAPETLDLRSHDIAAEKVEGLLRLFPEIRTEGGKLDFDRLKLALGEAVDVGRERYGMNWPGKAECFKAIQAPSLGTLRPCPDQSVNFDTTDNLIIEGDNLEVLKLLQKSYLGKVKMIYIDPPYNTGNDFIYPDNYSDSLQTYLEYTGQVDAAGRKFGTNTEADGRFHSKWLNMMYPRLYLARNLLREDGVIFISIDDDEADNLHKLCKEVFGEENFCGTFVWEKKKKPSFLNANLGVVTEYILAYARHRSSSPPFIAGKVEEGKKYPFNNAGNSLGILEFPPGSVRFGLADQVLEPQDMSEGNIITRLVTRLEVRNGRNASAFKLEGEWRYSQRKLDDFVASNADIYIAKVPFRPNYISNEDKDKKCKNLLSIESKVVGTYEDATAELNAIFGKDVMDYPKPTSLLAFLMRAVTTDGDIVLDFFAGSGTLAAAAVQLRADDQQNCKFILVQLPQPCDASQDTGKNALSLGMSTVADICKERVRRAISKVGDTTREKSLFPQPSSAQLGFRVFILARSNFTTWDAAIQNDPVALERQLELHVDHIRDDRTSRDILYEILLKSGFPLTTPVQEETLAGTAIYSVAGGLLIVCLEQSLSLELIRAIADRRPERVVCLDAGFAGNDQLKANAVQTFRTKGIASFRTI